MFFLVFFLGFREFLVWEGIVGIFGDIELGGGGGEEEEGMGGVYGGIGVVGVLRFFGNFF